MAALASIPHAAPAPGQPTSQDNDPEYTTLIPYRDEIDLLLLRKYGDSWLSLSVSSFAILRSDRETQ